MKTNMYIIFMIVILLSLVSCSNQKEDSGFDIFGEYTYGDCVYLNPLSSSTLDYQTELYHDIYYYDISEKKLLFYSNADGLLKTYENVEYRKVDIDLDLEDIFSLFSDDFLDYVDYRFDLYINNERIGLTIFQSNLKIYIAETRMLGGGNTIFSIWIISELIEQ